MPNGDTRITSGPKANLLVQGFSYKRDKEKTFYSYNLKLLNHDLEVLQIIDKLSHEMRPDKLRATEPLFCWSASHDNIFVVNEDRRYEIWVYDFNGKLIRKIQKEYRRVPISENYKEKILKQFPDLRNVLYFPEFYHPLQSFVAADDGKLLVSTYEEGKNPGEFMFDIFNEDGVFIGRKSLNIFVWEGHLWAKMTADKLYCLTEKDNGFKALYVYNMIWE